MARKGEGQTALVTGASRGIGVDLAECFAEDGYDLILTARSESALKDVADRLADKYKIKATPIALDLGATGAGRKLADEIATRAKNGEEFSSLVAQYSDDPGSKERQGSVGKFTREKMTKPFSDAAFALPVGGVSDAVESPFGYHVIKRNQ